ncbi:hypothetical protein EMCRGX_G004858 [Ephydatia muelleri]
MTKRHRGERHSLVIETDVNDEQSYGNLNLHQSDEDDHLFVEGTSDVDVPVEPEPDHTSDAIADDEAAVLYGNMELPLSCIHGVAAAPQCIVRWHGEEDRFERFDSEVTVQYLTPHPIKGKAAGRKVVMVPLILFSDDTSGNRSKKWHKFESYYLLLAGLPRKENMQHVNIHFICTSDSVTPLEMAEPIARGLTTLENEGFEVFDAYSNENVLVVAPLLLVICDNPRASELLNHLGSAANMLCRFCEADKRNTPHVVCEARTLERSLQQMAVIRSQPTQEKCNAMQTAFGLRAVDNPMLDIKVDTYRDFKAWAQMAVFILSPYLDDAQKKVLLSLSKVFRIAYCNYFTEELSTEWEGICEEFVLTAKRCLPEILMKPKIHLLLHLVNCMQDFGPSSAFGAERCESFNASVRAQNVNSNRLAPSRDISRHFAVQQCIRHICDIGSTREGNKCGKGLQNLYSSPVVKYYFNNITLRDLNSERRIYQRGALRKRFGRSSVVLKTLELGVVGLPHQTIEDLSSNDTSNAVQLVHCTADDGVCPHKGIISQDGELVRSGDFIELASCQRAVSVVHECLESCKFEQGASTRRDRTPEI